MTIVAMVHRYRATLPNRRVELYDECTEVLLGYWDQAKGIAGQLDWARKRRVLEPLAYWMHERGLREAERAQVEKVIAEALPTVGEKEASAAEFLKNVRERSGLLMERGLGIYGFSHLTFQEYLTATYLIDRGEEGREELLKHLHDPWWLEVTLLYAGTQDATPLITAILAQRDDLFKNNLFLAAHCLVDVINVDPHVKDETLSRLLEEFRAGEFEGLRDRAKESLVELGNSPSAPKVVEALLKLLDDEETNVRGSAASALGWLEQAEPNVVEALLKLLDDEEANVRGSAASALGWLEQAEPSVVEALLGLLDDDEAEVRGSATFALGRLGQAKPNVVEALLELLDDKEANVRRSAASALGWLEQAEPSVVEALLGLLDDKEANVRGSATFALGRLGQAKPNVVEALLGLLDDEDENVRWRAASALGQLGQAEPSVVEALLELLDDKEANVRRSAASALGWLEQAEPSVVEALLGLLDDKEANVRGSATFALGRLGQAKPNVVEALLGLLDDEDENVRWRAASALGQLGQAEPSVVEVLLKLLDDEEANVRWSTASALGKLGQAEPEVVEALLQRLSAEEASVRGSAAYALDPTMKPPAERIQQISPQDIPMLVDLLGDDREVEYPLTETRRKVKDVAWWLLQRYSEETGERIYRDDEG